MERVDNDLGGTRKEILLREQSDKTGKNPIWLNGGERNEEPALTAQVIKSDGVNVICKTLFM